MLYYPLVILCMVLSILAEDIQDYVNMFGIVDCLDNARPVCCDGIEYKCIGQAPIIKRAICNDIYLSCGDTDGLLRDHEMAFIISSWSSNNIRDVNDTVLCFLLSILIIGAFILCVCAGMRNYYQYDIHKPLLMDIVDVYGAIEEEEEYIL